MSQANANIEHPLFDAVGRVLYAHRTGENLELRMAELRASYYAHESLHRLEAIQTYHNLAREAEETKSELRRNQIALLDILERCAEQLAHCLGKKDPHVLEARAAIAKAKGGAL